MATVTITNLSPVKQHLGDIYKTLDPGESVVFARWIPELKIMPTLQTLYVAGVIDLEILVDGEELEFLNLLDLVEVTRHHAFQTNTTVGYAGGFYAFAGTPDDFSPAVNFGAVNGAIAAHPFVVTGAVPGDEVVIRVTGTSITDAGVRIPADTEDRTVSAGTAVNTKVEFKKFLGQVQIETISGTPISCNYGWAKYHDFNNQDFVILGLECIWESDSTDTTSNIELIHHRADGWTYNGGGPPTPPAPLASRSVDYGADNAQFVGEGAWKRSGLSTLVDGRDSEGYLWRVTSGSTGLGSLSFRALSLELSLRKLPPGNLP